MGRSPAHRASSLPAAYGQFLDELKARISAARTRAALAVNAELIQLYWEIGREIVVREERGGWGAKVIDRLSGDLRREFPEMTGLSARSLRYMRDFARAWPDEQIWQQAVAKLPWGHNVTLLDKLGDHETRLWYARSAIKNGWSRKVLLHHIETRLHERQGKAITSFAHALPAPDSELVRDVIKDPYSFEFLDLGEEVKERDLEHALLDDIVSFLLELGRGFAFVGRQFPLTVTDEETGNEHEFFVDLLFYHLHLRRYVVIDLKIDEFRPEYAGKMNFYLTAVDELVRQEGDEATIGLILCTSRSKTVAEWALRAVDAPVGVARYTVGETKLVSEPPEELKSQLPELPALKRELEGIVSSHEKLDAG